VVVAEAGDGDKDKDKEHECWKKPSALETFPPSAELSRWPLLSCFMGMKTMQRFSASQLKKLCYF
jgi:hypothetical protein